MTAGARRLGRLAAALLLCALAGCASQSSSPALFLLDDSDSAPSAAPPADAPTLVVEPVQLAAYLGQGGIVYQTAPNRVVVANDNRWAAPLAGQMTDTLENTLSGRLTQVKVERAGSAATGAYRLQVRVDKFLGRFDGSARIAGQWTLTGPDGRERVARAFSERIALARDGYPELVASLSQGWRRVLATIVPAVRHALPAATDG